MVDNRSAGFYGIGGAFNFKSGDISGTAANLQDDKMGPGTEYGEIPQGEEEFQSNKYVDRSAQLRATLNSLAMMNVAAVINERKKLEKLAKESQKEVENEEELLKVLDEYDFEDLLDDEFDSDEEND